MSKGLPKEQKTALIGDFRVNEKDTGSPEVQIAVLSKRIEDLTKHVQVNKKDHHTRLGLQKMVAKRRRLLGYLEREEFDRYKAVARQAGPAEVRGPH